MILNGQLPASIAALTGTQGQIDAVLNNPLQEETIPLIQNILKQLEDIIWVDMVDARLEHKVEKLEEIGINLKHQTMLNQDYKYWQNRMAQALCAPINPDFSGVFDIYGNGPKNFSVR